MKTNLYNHLWRMRFVGLLAWLGLTLGISRAEQVLQTEANVMVELAFTANGGDTASYKEAIVDFIFTDPNGREFRVPAFWAGENVWKVRYSSPVVGMHTFRKATASETADVLHGVSGKVEVKSYTGQNPLYAHGPLRVSSNRRHLEHTDGTPFFWLADTWWMGLCHRIQFPQEFQTLAADRKAKGFNVIQIVAGLYPDMPPFDPRGANEAGFPWEKEYASIRPEYFDAADRRIQHLIDQGFTPCIVGAWGYFISFTGVEKAKQHWRNLVARYGALPVVWCVAGEANLPYYQVKGFPYDDREQVKGWTEITRYLRQTDPFTRLITIHPTGLGRLSSRNAIDDVGLLDFDMLQTPHGEKEAIPPTVRTVRESYADQPVLPVINGEAAYEMLNGKISAQWARAMFWVCMLNGAAGHTYGANGIWQCNRKGQPHGPSPTAGSPPTGYGAIPWDEAMHLPGSQQVGFGKRLLEQYRWQDFEPHPEWATYAQGAPLSFEGCHWIWFPEGKPAQDAPTEKRFFRKSFELPEGKAIESARLRVSADDHFTVALNGKLLGTGADWKSGRQFNQIADRLNTGTNVLGIVAENLPSNVPANPAGMIASLEIQFAGGDSMRITSDESWRCSLKEANSWDTAGFHETGWVQAQQVGSYGHAPWGRIEHGANGAIAPQAAGIPGVARLIYVPESEAIIVRDFGANTRYVASYFDPVTGVKTAIADFRVDANGLWKCPPPTGSDHDWVVILETAPKQSVHTE